MDSVVELRELNNGNTTNQATDYQQHSQPQQPPHIQSIYLNQQQPQQSTLRYVGNPKVMPATKHRELPVDVPDSFVGIAKQSPRYPPPKSHRQISPSSMQINSTNLTSFNNHHQLQPPSALRASSTNAQAVATNSNQTSVPYQTTSSTNNIITNTSPQPNIPPMAQNTTANILAHNTSLRSSIKLKQLEKSRNGNQFPHGQMQPAINQAFEMNEDDAMPTVINQQQQAMQQKTVAPNSSHHHHQQHHPGNSQSQLKQQQAIKSLKQQQHQQTPDLSSIYNRLQQNLNREFADISNDAKLAKLLSIYNTIVDTRNKQFRVPSLVSRCTTTVNAQGNHEPLVYKVTDLLRSLIFLFKDEEIMTPDVAELWSILCKHEFEGVCSAFDRISQSFEFAQSSSPDTSYSTDIVQDDGHVQQQQQQQQVQQPKKPIVYNHNGTTNTNQRSMQTAQSIDDYEYGQNQVHMDIDSSLYPNGLHPLTDIDLSDGACTKLVRVETTPNQHLGATIRNVDGSVMIGRILVGGTAHMSGLLHEGDEILEINGISMRGKNVNEVVDLIKGMNSRLTFKVVTRNFNKPHPMNQEEIYVKAFFNYDGTTDIFNPCKEIGLSFVKGDILGIIDQSDHKWWQAHHDRDSGNHLAGLIPSVEFLKQREKDTTHEDSTAAYFKQDKRNFLSILFKCPKGDSSRGKKKHFSVPYGPEEIPYYEEVCLYYPNKYKKRPIILVGPKMIGQREIATKLLSDTNRFASAISHTSRPMADHERNGVDFHFVSRAQFESDIKAGKFLECGQYQNQYYGTSLEAMKEVVRSKKTCIHLVNTPSVFNFRQGRAGSELKPFFVFVKPDDSHPEKVRNLVANFSPPKSNLEENVKAIMSEVQLIENNFLPYFDLVLTVTDIDRAYQELLKETEKIEIEPQWIPMFWQDAPSN